MRLILLVACIFMLPVVALADVRIDSPANGATVGGVVPVTISWRDADPQYPIRFVRLTVSGPNNYYKQYFSTINPPVVSGGITFSWDSSGALNDTVHSLYALAGSGYSGVPDFTNRISVTANNPSPVIIITSPLEGQQIAQEQATIWLVVSYHNVPPNYHGIHSITYSTSWNIIRSVTLSNNPASGTYGWELSMGALPLGEHSITVTCTDDFGYRSNPVTVHFKKVKYVIPEIDPKKQVPADKATTVGEPINVANGNMFTNKTDISIPVRELFLELSRTYNSQDDFYGQLGYGWRSNFDIVLKEYPDGTAIETDESGVYAIYSKNADGTYRPSAGKYSVLTKTGGTFTILRKHGQKLYFDAQGRLIKIEGRNGNTINITRISSGAISEVTDPAGRKLLFTNDAQGRVTQVTDPANRVFKYEYDANGNLTKVTDPLNNITTYQYDSNHKRTLETDANDHNLYFEYDSSGRAHHSWQDANINEVTLSFDPENKTTVVTDSRGNATKYEYDSYGLVTKMTDSQNHTQLTSWDANLNKISFTDENSNTATYTYDAKGNLLTTANPLSNVTTFTYEPTFDLIKTVTDTQGNVTTYDYDAKGNLSKLTDALGNFMTNTYDTFGQLISTTNPKNFSTNFTYDAFGNLEATTDALNNITTFSYDLMGNRIQIKDAKNNITQFTYNGLNQLIEVIYSDGSKVTYTYDAFGNKLSTTDNASQTTTYTYDLNNHVTSITNPLAKTITYSYDSEGNRTKVTDQSLKETNYQYDSLNRLVSEANSLGLVKSYGYDAAGNRTSLINPKGDVITYEYDSLRRLKKINYPENGSVSFEYDSLGRRTTMTDSRGITSYAYDKLGRLIQVDGPEDNDTISYTYDLLGNRLSLTLPDGKTVNYSYDALNRLTSITDPNSKTTTYTYDEVGNPVNITYPNNVQAFYSFDALHRLTQLTNQNQSTQAKFSEFTYTYDPAGRRSRITSLDAITDYAYDSLGELTSEIKSLNGANLYQAAYEYDPSGNRTRMLKDGTEHIYSYNSLNQLTQEGLTGPAAMPITVTGTVSDANGIQTLTVNGSNAVLNGNSFSAQISLSSGENTLTVTATDKANNTATKSLKVTYVQTDQILYVYDNNGNLIHKQSATQELSLSYDYENRLTRVIASPAQQGEAIYAYDGEGKRVLKEVTMSQGHQVTSYLYDGLDVVLERNGSGDPVATYLRNPYSAGGIGGIISSQGLIPGQGTVPEVYYSYDGLGSVANLSDTSGINIQSYIYEAFGNTLTPSSSGNSRQFLTKELDSAGLIYFGARYYDPSIGRFITQDPMGMIDGPNVYVYCWNNPVDMMDPNGLCLKKAWRWAWQYLLEPPYYSLTQPGYNYGLWMYGEKNLVTFYGACLDSTWAIGTIYSTIQAVIANGAPYWQYYPTDNPAYSSRWLTRGANPPYQVGEEARDALNLPQPRNPGTAVRQVEVNWWEPIRGPRPVNGGTGVEYYRGWKWPQDTN